MKSTTTRLLNIVRPTDFIELIHLNTINNEKAPPPFQCACIYSNVFSVWKKTKKIKAKKFVYMCIEYVLRFNYNYTKNIKKKVTSLKMNKIN